MFQPGGGAGGAVGEVEGIDGDRAVERGFVEEREQGAPIGGAFAQGHGAGAAGGSGEGIAGADVADEGAEAGKDLIGGGIVLQKSNGVEIDAEPGARGGGDGAL